MKSLIVYFLLSIPLTSLIAQEVGHNIDLIQNNKEIFISITINKGSTCNGMDIYRSTDTLLGFDKIGNIFGVCGSVDFNQDYRFTDINPVPNTINYYKIVFGGRQDSKTHSIYYASYNDYGYSIFNESNQTTLFINSNITLKKMKFDLYDSSGKLLQNIQDIIEDKITFANYALHHGFYFFVLSEENNKKLIQGKLFIP
jgi:hypothetical protein